MSPSKKTKLTTVVTAAILLLYVHTQLAAFNPQPEPPGDYWKVQGFVDMTALTSAPLGDEHPFSVDPVIIGDGDVDFYASVFATFEHPTNPLTGRPADGIALPTMHYFRLQIGDTTWDETMIPTGATEFELAGGAVIGWKATYTHTNPGHPDLELFFPNSPGMWLATDEANGVNLGTIAGSYELRDAVVLPSCDFNTDGQCDVDDLDMMQAAGPLGPTGIPASGNEDFDLNGDGTINVIDRNQWLAEAATENGLGSPYKLGDANINGIVDGQDFLNWNAAKFTGSLLWSDGNFDANAVVDGRDFLAWNANKFTSSDGMSSIPETRTNALVLLAASVIGWGRHREKQRLAFFWGRPKQRLASFW